MYTTTILRAKGNTISWDNSHIEKRKERHQVKSKILYIVQPTPFQIIHLAYVVYDMVEIKLSLLNRLTNQKDNHDQIFQYQVNFHIMPLLQLQQKKRVK